MIWPTSLASSLNVSFVVLDAVIVIVILALSLCLILCALFTESRSFSCLPSVLQNKIKWLVEYLTLPTFVVLLLTSVVLLISGMIWYIVRF